MTSKAIETREEIMSPPTMEKFEDYKERFNKYLIMKRENGILEVRLHTDGGPVKWSHAMHRALIDAWSMIGHDLENHVMILTSTGEHWMGTYDKEAFARWDAVTEPDLRYDGLRRPIKSVENFVFDIDIPTIAAINGPGTFHVNFALLCDIVLCTPDFVLRDHHFQSAAVPGDSIALCFQAQMGIKRAAFMMYMSNGVDAQTALEWGVVNEVVPRDKLLPRAWEIAAEIMKQPRAVRCLTSQLVKRPLKKAILEDYQLHIVSEIYAHNLIGRVHDVEQATRGWAEREKLTKTEK